MANHDELFQPERVNEQVEQLARIQDLQQQQSTPGAPTIAALGRMYQEDEVILERARARLANARAATFVRGSRQPIVNMAHVRGANTMQTKDFSRDASAPALPAVPPGAHPPERSHAPRQRWSRAISPVAATLTLVVIVGSLLWAISALHSKKAITASAPVTTSSISVKSVYVGSADGLVRADAQTGKVVWRYQIPTTANPNEYSFAQILPAGSVVYGLIQSFTSSTPTQVIAFDAASGRVLWSYKSALISSMALGQNTLYLGVEDTDPQANHSSIAVLDVSTGAPLATTYPLNGSSPQLAVVGEVLYAATTTNVAAIDPAHHQQIWQKSGTDLGLSGPAEPAIRGFSIAQGTLYATLQAGHSVSCVALQADSGDTLWQAGPITVTGASGGGAGITAPVVGDSLVYFATYGTKGAVFAYHEQDGTLAWSRQTDGGMIQRAPVFSDHTLYAAEDILSTSTGSLSSSDPKTSFVALNTTTGAITWQTSSQQGVGTSISVLDGIVYGATGYAQTTSVTYALKATTGHPIWQAELGENPTSLVTVGTN